LWHAASPPLSRGTTRRGAPAAPGGFPAVNVYAGQDGIAVVAELPGVGKDDLEVQVHQNVLTLRGARRPAAEQPGAYHRRERRRGAFTRTVQLPYRVDPERIAVRADRADGPSRPAS
jgi:HSP20 family protein